MEIVQGQVGPEAKYDVAFTGGKLLVTAAYAGAEAGATLAFHIDSDALLDKLAAAIPGTLAPEIIALVKIALKAV